MRITLTLEDDVAAKVRAGVAQRRCVGSAPVFELEPRHSGAPLPEFSCDCIGTLLDWVGGAQHR